MKCHLSSFLNVPPHCQREFVFKRIWNLIGRAEPFETPSNMICHFHICQFPSSRSSCCELNATSPFASSASRIKIKLVGYIKHIRIASITDPGLKGLGLPADEGHDAVVPDVLDVVNGGAGASVLLLPPPQTSQSPFPFGQAVPACPDPGP